MQRNCIDIHKSFIYGKTNHTYDTAVPPLGVTKEVVAEPLSKATNLTPVPCYVSDSPNPTVGGCLRRDIFVINRKYQAICEDKVIGWEYAWRI